MTRIIYRILDETLKSPTLTALKEVSFFGGCEVLFLYKVPFLITYFFFNLLTKHSISILPDYLYSSPVSVQRVNTALLHINLTSLMYSKFF